MREEKTDSLYSRLLKSFLRGSYEGSLNAHKIKDVDSDNDPEIHAARRAAGRRESGNSVIVGRGSQHFLKDREDTLRVFLYAPRRAKMAALADSREKESEAEQLVDSVDQERADFIRKYFAVEWPDRAIYHAMINTAIGDVAVVHSIVDFMKLLDAAPQPSGA